MIEKQKSALLKRRKIAIIAVSAIALILIPIVIFVNYFVKIEKIYDVDETEYFIKYKSGSYAIYDADGVKLDIDEEYGYYITKIGTLIELDSETGEYEIIAVVDTEYTEVLGHNQRVLMFPHTEKKNIRSIEVVNSEGSFTFHRYNIETDKLDDSIDFTIKGAPFTSFDQELFASLYVSAGYTITTRKIQDPIKDANGEFTEYGLADEIRVDEDGNEYEYTPAYYILTDTSGNRHKVLIGDLLVTGGGYYVQYVDIESEVEEKRDAVYVLPADLGNTALVAIEDFATPQIVYPMSMNNYTDVQNFNILKENKDIEEGYDHIVGFSFIDLALRENSIQANIPYNFTIEKLKAYTPDSDNVNTALYYLYDMDFAGVVKLCPTDTDLVEYGLSVESENDKGEKVYELGGKYVISYDSDITDEDTEEEMTIHQRVIISAPNEEGNYYAYSLIYKSMEAGKEDELLYSYDMIVEIKGYCLDFLEWSSLKWVNSSYLSLNIAYCDKIILESPDYSAEFDLDNSASDQSEKTNSDKLVVNASDSKGNSIKTFSNMTVVDTDGIIWNITTSEITAYNRNGEKMKIETAYYAYNKLGSQVRVVSGYIPCADGSKVAVTADEVIVTSRSGEETRYVRYATSLFRKFFQTLLYSDLENTYEMTEEEEAALIADESKWLLTIIMTDTEGKTTEYKFYKLTSMKAYITADGKGDFYVLSDRLDKFISDAQKFFALEVIDPEAKR